MDVLLEYWPLVLAVTAAGLFAGLIAGMFGVGGGIVIVPALYHAFGAVGVSDETRMHAAVATSLATIIATSARSVQAHAKRQSVDFTALRQWAPWIVLGALIGGMLARLVPADALSAVFAVGACLVAVRMARGGTVEPMFDDLPRGPARAGIGGALGFVSSWMGIGGGVFGVVLMTLSGRPMHQAVGTAAGFGAAIGAPGALGFIIAGLGVDGRPPFSLGYVNGPGFLLIATLTVLTAPFGARLAHGLSRTLLQRLFAAGLSVVALQMGWEALSPFFSGAE